MAFTGIWAKLWMALWKDTQGSLLSLSFMMIVRCGFGLLGMGCGCICERVEECKIDAEMCASSLVVYPPIYPRGE